MKTYIDKNFTIVSGLLLSASDLQDAFRVFYENEAQESIRIRGFGTCGDVMFVRTWDTHNVINVNVNDKIYITNEF